MANVTIYLNKDVEKQARRAARQARKPLSRWLADLVESNVRGEWPEEFLALAGSMPDVGEPEEMNYGSDAARERFPNDAA